MGEWRITDSDAKSFTAYWEDGHSGFFPEMRVLVNLYFGTAHFENSRIYSAEERRFSVEVRRFDEAWGKLKELINARGSVAYKGGGVTDDR